MKIEAPDLTPVYCPCGWKGTENEVVIDYRPKPGGFVDEITELCPRCGKDTVWE